MSADGPGSGVVCVGRLYCDLIFTEVPELPSMGKEVYAGGLGIHAGGGAFITAAYLASLGRSSSLACTLPCNPFRELLLSSMKTAGLDTRLCQEPSADADPQITVAIVGQEDRAFLTRRTGAAAPEIDEMGLRQLGIRHLHVGELATLLECPWILDVAQSAGSSVSVDCGWDEGMDFALARDLLRRVDVFFPNAAEARMLSEAGLSDVPANLTVIKQGADGASVRRNGATLTEPAIPTTPIDTTGAGDAFNAGFLDAWLDGAAVDVCLRAGNRLGAQAIGSRGGYNPPPGRDQTDGPRSDTARLS